MLPRRAGLLVIRDSLQDIRKYHPLWGGVLQWRAYAYVSLAKVLRRYLLWQIAHANDICKILVIVL